MKRYDWDNIVDTLRHSLQKSPETAVTEDRQDPFKVLVSTVISLRTKDEVTAVASEKLLARADSPGQMMKLAAVEIQQLIYPAGFYRNKARHLMQIAEILVNQYGGLVPSQMKLLLALPGVGRKTANLVRNLGFGLPGICVDTHVHRISNRAGWVATRNPTETEAALEKILPEKFWIAINGLLVRFGKTVCTPVSPFCSSCPMPIPCPRVGVERFR